MDQFYIFEAFTSSHIQKIDLLICTLSELLSPTKALLFCDFSLSHLCNSIPVFNLFHRIYILRLYVLEDERCLMCEGIRKKQVFSNFIGNINNIYMASFKIPWHSTIMNGYFLERPHNRIMKFCKKIAQSDIYGRCM